MRVCVRVCVRAGGVSPGLLVQVPELVVCVCVRA